jgi:outer membrane protein
MRNLLLGIGFTIIGSAWAAVPPVELSLPQAVAYAQAHSPSLAEAQSRLQGGWAAVARATAPRRTLLKVEARQTHVSEVSSFTIIPGWTPVTLGANNTTHTLLGVQRVLYSGGRLEGALLQATTSAQAAEVSVIRLRQQVTFDATRAFLTLVATQHEAEVTRQALQTAETQCANATSRYKSGAAARFDVMRAEVQVEEARLEEMRASDSCAAAQASLVRVLGQEEGDYRASVNELPVPSAPPSLASLRTYALAMRPELRLLAFQLAGAEAARHAALGERRPTVSVAGDYQLVSPETPTALSRWAIGLVASLPIFDGGMSRAKLQEAEALRGQVQAALAGQRAAIVAEVRVGHARAESALAQLAVARKREDLARELHRIAGVRYTAGVGTALEVADAQTALTRARQGTIRALTDWQLAMAELRLAVGIDDLAGVPAQVEGAP